MGISIHISTVVATMINFLVLLAILNYFLFKPVNKLINKRQEDIKSSIDLAKQDREKAEELRLQSENEYRNNLDKGKSIIAEYKVKAEDMQSDILKQAKSEAELIMERARKEADREREKLKAEIKTEAINLAILVSSKALEETIDEDKQRKLIEDFIAKVGA